MNRIVCLCCLAVLIAGVAAALPLDMSANITALAQMSRMSRTASLPPDVLTTARAQATAGNADVALVALLLLAYADDAESTTTLHRVAADAGNPLLAGAAAYGLYMQETRALRDDAAESSLTFALGRAANPYTRLFLAAQLHVSFGETAMPALLADAREEHDPVVQAFLLQYLSASDDVAILRATAALPWPATVNIPENLVAVMHTLYPVANPLDDLNPCISLLQQVNGKLDPRYMRYRLDSYFENWWGRYRARQDEEINAIAEMQELARMEDVAHRIDRQHISGILQICHVLTNTVTGMKFGEQRHTIGARLLRGLLQHPECMDLSTEVRIIECLTQFGSGQQQGITDEEWAKERQDNAPLVLHAWKRLLTAIDPNFEMNQRMSLQPDLPPGANFPPGVAPEAIDDPQLRAQYEKNIEQHRLHIAIYNEQHEARQLQRTFIPRAEQYLIALYTHLPDDRVALGKLLATHGIDADTQARMLQAVSTTMKR